jgi:hypothetical protein
MQLVFKGREVTVDLNLAKEDLNHRVYLTRCDEYKPLAH